MTEDRDMNHCEDIQVLIAAEPADSNISGHIAECSACAAFAADMRSLDAQLSQAMLLPVPELKMPELPAIDTSNVTALPRKRFGAPTWLAMAATITVAALVGWRMTATEVSTQPLVDQIVAHLEHEPYAFDSVSAVSDARLARIVPANIATMDHDHGLITYAQSCVIDGKEVPHLVIQGEHGPVTILLMPDQMIDGPQSISGESINGVLIPVGSGSIAIVGEEAEDLERIERNVKDSVAWDA